jgi:hypothetical protein
MTPDFDASKLNDTELARLIAYLKRKRLTTDPRYALALEAQAEREGRGYTFEATLALIRDAARASPDRWLTYAELSASIERRWGQAALTEVNKHLARLCEWAVNRGLPLFSAWVVPASAAKSGKLEGVALRGFVDCAKGLDLKPGNTAKQQDAFVEAQRRRIREWAELAA